MNVEELAAFSQREFETIRNEMLTRDELKATEGTILRAIDELGIQISRSAFQWSADFERLSDQVEDIGNRLRLMESDHCGP